MTGKTQRENAIENSPLLRPPKVSQFRLNLNFIVRYERLPTYIHAYLPTYMPTYIHTRPPTYMLMVQVSLVLLQAISAIKEWR